MLWVYSFWLVCSVSILKLNKNNNRKKKISHENLTINWTHASRDYFAAKRKDGSHL